MRGCPCHSWNAWAGLGVTTGPARVGGEGWKTDPSSAPTQGLAGARGWGGKVAPGLPGQHPLLRPSSCFLETQTGRAGTQCTWQPPRPFFS